jgi:hypothetical protein
MQLPRETAIAAKGALLHVGGIASDDLPLPCRIRGSAAIYSIPGAIIRRLAIESMVSPERSKESKATSYGPRPRKGSFTLIWGYTRIGYSRGSLRVGEWPSLLWTKRRYPMGVAGWRFAHMMRTLRVRAVLVGVLEELPFICPVLVAIGSLTMIGITLYRDWPQ